MQTVGMGNVGHVRRHPYLAQDLPGGTRVIGIRVPTAKNLTVVIGVPAGMRHERPGEEGMMHLIEHLVYQDSDTTVGIARQLQVAHSGGVLGGHTHMDYTEFYETGQPQDLTTIARRLADQVFFPAFRPEQIAEQIRAVATERAHRLGKAPGGVLPWPHLTSRHWADHARGHDGSGDHDLTGRATPESLRALHSRHYRPQSAVVVAASPHDPNETVDVLAAAMASVIDRARDVETEAPAAPVAAGPAPARGGAPRDGSGREGRPRTLAASPAAPAWRVTADLVGDALVAAMLTAQEGIDASAGLFGPGDLLCDDLFVVVDDTPAQIDAATRIRAVGAVDDAQLVEGAYRAVLTAERLVHDDERLARTVTRDVLLRQVPGFGDELVAALDPLVDDASRARELVARSAARLAGQDFVTLSLPATGRGGDA